MFEKPMVSDDKQIIREGIYVFTEFLKRNFSVRKGKLISFSTLTLPPFQNFQNYLLREPYGA